MNSFQYILFSLEISKSLSVQCGLCWTLGPNIGQRNHIHLSVFLSLSLLRYTFAPLSLEIISNIEATKKDNCSFDWIGDWMFWQEIESGTSSINCTRNVNVWKLWFDDAALDRLDDTNIEQASCARPMFGPLKMLIFPHNAFYFNYGFGIFECAFCCELVFRFWTVRWPNFVLFLYISLSLKMLHASRKKRQLFSFAIPHLVFCF